MTEEKNDEKVGGQKGFRVSKVRVFLTDLPEDGGEGVVAMPTPQGLIPLVAMDDKQFEAFKDMAQQMANESGKSIRAVEFTSREDLHTFEKQLVQVPSMSMGAKIGAGGFKIGALKDKG